MAARLAPGLERRLRAEVTGDVLFDRVSRYATDVSRESVVRGLARRVAAARAETTAAIAAAPTIDSRGMAEDMVG